MYAIEMWNLICVTGSLSREPSDLPLKNEAHKVRNAKGLAAMWKGDRSGADARLGSVQLREFRSHPCTAPAVASCIILD